MKRPPLYKPNQTQQVFMCKLASHFIKASIIQQHKEESKLFSALSVSPDNQKDDIDLRVVIMTCNLLKKSLDEGDITQALLTSFLCFEHSHQILT